MPKILKYLGQDCMDNYFQNFRSDFQFFDLQDFIDNAGQTVAAIYQRYYELQYRELRGDRKDEVVTFDAGMLVEQILKVENKGGNLFADLKQPVMTFMYDQNSAGIQSVFNTADNTELDRTTVNELWQLPYVPKTNRTFFYSGINRLNFVNKGDCNVKEVRVWYVPSMYADAIIADTIADEALQTTILQMRQLADKQVVKKSLDNNENKILETEIDKG